MPRAQSATADAAHESANGASATAASAAQKAKTPLIAVGGAAAGLVGGIVLGTRVLAPRRKTVLGVPLPRKGVGLQPMGKEIQKAGQQLGRLAKRGRQARQQAKQVGDALS